MQHFECVRFVSTTKQSFCKISHSFHSLFQFQTPKMWKNRTEPCLVSSSFEQRESQNGNATVQRAACNSSNESPRESLGSVPSTYKTIVARTNGVHR